MEKVYIFTKMVISIMVNGKMIKKMVRAYKNINNQVNTKESGKTTKNMEMDNLIIKMVMYMMVIGMMIKNKNLVI